MSNELAQNLKMFQDEVESLIRARYPLLYLYTYEESRALELIKRVSSRLGLIVNVWSRTKGVVRDGETINPINDPLKALSWVEEQKEDGLFIFLDFHPYLKDASVLRKIRDLGQELKTSKRNLIFISPNATLPEDVSKDITILDMPLPCREETKEIIKDAALASNGEDINPDACEEVIDAATGLTTDEIENALAKSLVVKGGFEAQLIQKEKKQIIKKSGILDFVEVQNMDIPDVGGLDQLQQWLRERKVGFSQAARDEGLPVPKGVLMVGIPGCGKSLTAVTISRLWKMPLVRLDMGKIFSGLVGSSENNVRSVIKTAEAVSPCILWVDEIEKGLSGSSQGGRDGGTSSRVFGTLLTWLQEKKSSVFVVATANDVSAIPPEFLRKGRFDEIFFIDLPTEVERTEILQNLAKKFGWSLPEEQVSYVAQQTGDFSGAELEQLLIDSKFKAFHNGKSLERSDFDSVLSFSVPLARMMEEKIRSLREWATTRARRASSNSKTVNANDVVHGRFAKRTQNMERAH